VESDTKVYEPAPTPLDPATTERFSIAPMMDYTDRHFRYLLRMITKKAWLYTEMVTSEAVRLEVSVDLVTTEN